MICGVCKNKWCFILNPFTGKKPKNQKPCQNPERKVPQCSEYKQISLTQQSTSSTSSLANPDNNLPPKTTSDSTNLTENEESTSLNTTPSDKKSSTAETSTNKEDEVEDKPSKIDKPNKENPKKDTLDNTNKDGGNKEEKNPKRTNDNETSIEINNKKPRLTLTLSNSSNTTPKSSTNASSNIPTTPSNSSATTIRFSNYRRTAYVIRCNEEKSDLIIKSIASNFGIDTPANVSFSSMKHAKEFVIRNISAVHATKSIYQFTFPISCQHLIKNEIEANNNISLTYHDILSCFDEKYVNDTALSFATLCLNFYAYRTKDKNSIPHIIFGDILDTEKMVFNEHFHPEIFDYVNLKTPFNSFEEDTFECVKGMREWYCKETKHYLRRMLDYYQSKNQTINSYATIVNVSNNHWIFIYVDLFPEHNENDPYVLSIDGMKSSGSHAFHIRRAFAKYFGLYL